MLFNSCIFSVMDRKKIKRLNLEEKQRNTCGNVIPWKQPPPPTSHSQGQAIIHRNILVWIPLLLHSGQHLISKADKQHTLLCGISSPKSPFLHILVTWHGSPVSDPCMGLEGVHSFQGLLGFNSHLAMSLVGHIKQMRKTLWMKHILQVSLCNLWKLYKPIKFITENSVFHTFTYPGFLAWALFLKLST